jgi:hypothetical protein
MFVSELTSLIQRGKQFTRGAVHRRDSSTLIESGLEEHLHLEYKSASYEDNNRGRREFLLGICMFANSAAFCLSAYPNDGMNKVNRPDRRTFSVTSVPQTVPFRQTHRNSLPCLISAAFSQWSRVSFTQSRISTVRTCAAFPTKWTSPVIFAALNVVKRQINQLASAQSATKQYGQHD